NSCIFLGVAANGKLRILDAAPTEFKRRMRGLALLRGILWKFFALRCTDVTLGLKEKDMDTLDAVLDRIDQDFEKSRERLCALLRIKSISTDPAYKDQCRAAAVHVAKDLASLGFDVEVRPTAGHPVVLAKSGNGAGPRVLFYGHYDVQP